jgi:hypothetical protein
MATTTPNFGWPVPTSTDLVKDGATAIEALGDGVDASLVDLKGGLTGQVLAKATGADMDFAWVTTDDTNAIQNAIVDAKGDLIAASAADTPARLAVGNNGETLVADSAATTGLRYSATPSASNPTLNSAFQVWQRGTSMAGGSNGTTFCADRWNAYATGSTTFSRQVTGDTTNLPNIQYCARVSRDSGSTGTGVIIINQNFETVNTIPFAGKTVTMSFYARKGANYSMASSNILSQLSTGTGTDQSYITTGYTGEVALISQNSTLTTTWQRFTYTATVASNVTEMSMQWRFTPVGTAGAADYFEITGVQLDVGSVALPFRTYAATIQGELAACQRYYYRNSGVSADYLANGLATSTTAGAFFYKFAQTMRVVPTAMDFSNVAMVLPGTADYAITNLTFTSTTKDGTRISATGATGMTQDKPLFLNLNGTGFIGFTAEL